MEKELLNKPLVSIITPSFNQAEFIEETICSVIKQDYDNIEHIIIDGGSTDGSVEIIRKYEKHIAWWISEQDKGQSDALAKGFSRANGAIFGWLCSDDLLMPSTVRLAVEELLENDHVSLVYGDRLYIDAKGNVVDAPRLPSYWDSMLRMNITIPQETAFFRREVFEQVGGIDLSLKCSMDFDLWCRLAKKSRFKHIPAFMGSYRLQHNAKSVAFGDQASDLGKTYRSEHDRVYRQHFDREPPSRSLMTAFTMYRRFRSVWETLVPHYRKERFRIQDRLTV
jgi:glycosyltransferase involved in cell wall biosynthesis